MSTSNKVKALNKEHNRVAEATAKGLTPELKEKLLNDINSGRGTVTRAGMFALGADIQDLATVTRQVRLYAGMVLELGGNATPNDVDKFAETSTGRLFWGYADGTTPYEQKPSKIMFGTYFKQTIGELAWSNKLGKKEILTYTTRS